MKKCFLAAMLVIGSCSTVTAGQDCKEAKCRIRILPLRAIVAPVVEKVECTIEKKVYRTPVRDFLFGRFQCKAECK